MKTGDIITVALPGDTGKPRPAVVLISDQLAQGTSRIIVLPMTTTLLAIDMVRVSVRPSAQNGLRQQSQIMIDRVTSVSREKVGTTIGFLDQEHLDEMKQRLLAFTGLP